MHLSPRIAAAIAAAALLPTLANAAPPCGRGWRRGEWCGWRVFVAAPSVVVPRPVYVAPPAVYVTPAPFYAAPPAVIFPPPVQVAPSLSLGINIPLH